MGERGQGLVLALGTILAIALIVGGAAVVARSGGSTIQGTNGPDQLIGTEQADTIDGLAGSDTIKGRGGADVLTGGAGFDLIYGGRGGDRIKARDNHVDQIDCGPGSDTAIVDRAEDGVFDCERVVVPTSFEKARRR
jgi:Ca2+-binding RTX toxin-like protein